MLLAIVCGCCRTKAKAESAGQLPPGWWAFADANATVYYCSSTCAARIRHEKERPPYASMPLGLAEDVGAYCFVCESCEDKATAYERRRLPTGWVSVGPGGNQTTTRTFCCEACLLPVANASQSPRSEDSA